MSFFDWLVPACLAFAGLVASLSLWLAFRPRGWKRSAALFLAGLLVPAVALGIDRAIWLTSRPAPSAPSTAYSPAFVYRGMFESSLVGTKAADLTLRDARTGRLGSLREYRDRPLVLIFGSWG